MIDTKNLRAASMAVIIATDEAVSSDLTPMLRDAADEIDSLRARVARLEEALRGIEKYNDWPNRVLKIARSALEEK